MREIKFRAWDGEEMSAPFHLYGPIDYGALIDGDDVFLLDSEDTIVMQYTGLKDKNGKEIYEGDVLRFDWPHDMPIVGWLDEAAGFLPFIDEDYRVNACEVIGNIYQNPELVKEV